MAERYLILEDGSSYRGEGFGAEATTTGELIYNTNLTGYQEVVTNQIYHNQIIIFSQPSIGNTGISHDAYESILPTAKGMVVRDVTNFSVDRSRRLTLDTYLKQHNIPGISGIDTRHLIRKLRDAGPMNGSIVAVDDAHAFDQLHATVLTNRQVAAVATPKPYPNPGTGYNVVVIDFGLKNGLLRQLSERRCNVTVVPWDTTAENILNLDPDGVILSSGPGSPMDLPQSVLEMIQVVEERIPLFAIGLGHELFGLANGANVVPLDAEYHGSSHPIRRIITNDIVFASQGQGYAVEAKSINRERLITTYVDLINGTVQGLRHRDFPAFSVQFFPDGGPGPDDNRDLFDEFMEIMGSREG
ncbi:carbamoyl phosphate synthase small subunit [Levilactobacillus bambusae]|uniref:Carbamoyl phosphate synthase small chain n=1 Tax=Levilactobacillus bambusae TaxID=2024736 RepID=A0A2V1N5A8_9LACO|nr:carbamoyl phosphate synthase small subunit [Levilactobacillus bambusae]PWG00860.1 carbamoyl phosphate synthase small subunit [Levilactobacillus bambusae]